MFFTLPLFPLLLDHVFLRFFYAENDPVVKAIAVEG